MFRLSALNEQTNESTIGSHESVKGTKEAQEAYAFGLYNNALQLQSDQCHDEAIKVYENLLQTSLVTNAATTLVDENGEAMERPLKDPGLILKYSTHKNMASMAADSGDINTAMEHYLQAVMLDPSDVTLWQRIGTHAISLGRLALARHAFTSGLQCNDNYWPCLDSAITVLYALSDYETCMYWIAKALEKDFGYTKGLVFREKMIGECPHLQADCQALFNNCSLLMYDVEIDEEEANQLINEALELREQHRIVCKPQPPKSCPLSPPLKKLSWLSLGESLLSTYELVSDSTEYTFTSPILFGDLSGLKCQNITEESLEMVDIETVEDEKLADKLNETVDTLKDDQSVTEQSTEESMGFSEDSQADLPHAAQEDDVVTSQWFVTQELDACQLFDDEIVKDIVERLVRAVCSNNDHNEAAIVKETVEKIVTMASQNHESDVFVAKNILDDLVEKVVEKVSEAKTSKICQSADSATNVNDESDQEKSKKVAKKKKFYFDSVIEEHMMRRSDRVKISSKKKKQQQKNVSSETEISAVNYVEELNKLLPEKLRLEDTGGRASPETEPDSDSLPTSFSLDHVYQDEADDVVEFVRTNEAQYIVNVMKNYYHALADKIHLAWEKGVREIVAKIFVKTQAHLIQPYLSDVTDFKPIKRLVFDNLTGVECAVDVSGKKGSGESLTYPAIFEQFDFLMTAAKSYVKIFKAEDCENFDDKSRIKTWKPFTLRTLWARSKHNAHLFQFQDAISDLEFCKEILNTVRTDPFTDEQTPGESPQNYVIELPNMDQYPIISMNTITTRLKCLEQTQVYRNADQLFQEGLYNEVVNILQPTAVRVAGSKPAGGSHRSKQIRQLLLSYQHLSDYTALFNVAGNVVDEIVEALKALEASKKRAASSKRKNDSPKQWLSVLSTALQAVEKAVKSLESFDEVHNHATLSRAVVRVIDYLLLRIDQGNMMKSLLLAWTILYRLLAYTECDREIANNENPPASLALLDTAHKWLGEKNLCCSSEGSFLKLFISEINQRFSKLDVAFKEECDYYVEQCFYCLYSFPNRPKTKRIEDHDAKQAPLTWKDGVFLFQHFRPTYLPEFDSFKTSTVSLELSQFLLKLLPLFPPRILKEIKNSETDLLQFIDHNCDDVTMLKQSSSDELSLLSDIYYLLADYYFKNNEMTKAVKYYLLDLRISTVRFDAWAGLALAKSSQIDDRLRLCENKKSQHKVKESGTERRGMAALACFKQALSLDSHNTKLWIEYGSLAYWMHSMISRKMKRSDQPLPEDGVKKAEMLRLSRHSFEKIQECESDEVHDEEWLVQYMLGKVSEKEKRPLTEFIKHYQNAAYMLHRRNAKYPKKIQSKYGYVNDYAIEALEMHFRIHSSILKYTLRNPYMTVSEQSFIKDVLEELKLSPFVLRQELKSQNSAQDSEKSSKLVITSQSSDLTMGSLLPDNVLRSLNIEEAKPDEENDTQSSACSLTQPGGEPSMEEADTREQHTHGGLAPQTLQFESETETQKSNDVATQQSVESTSQVDVHAITESCESAFRLCVRRFPHHIKAIYRLSHIYATSASKKHLSWSRDLLYGTSSSWQQLRHMPAPGLLSDRNKTNLFNGVWRIPMDDIDRPGSFPAHLYRCLALLLDLLLQFEHHEALLHIHNLLHRTPEQGKKYLREEDRILLARRALAYCRGIISRKISSLGSKEDAVAPLRQCLSSSSKPASIGSSQESSSTQSKELGTMVDRSEESLNVLMDAYRVYQETQKHTEATTRVDLESDPDDKTHQRLLVEAYHKYSCLTANFAQRLDVAASLKYERKNESQADKSTLLDEALRFCHQQNALRKALTTSSKPVPQSVTSSSNQSTNNAKPTAAIMPQKRREEFLNADSKAEKKEQNENGTQDSRAAANIPTHGQITMVEDKGRTYTRIAPPPVDPKQRVFAPGGALDPSTLPEKRPLRLDPGLLHLQVPDLSKKQLLRSTSVPVTYPAGVENTPPHHRMLSRTGSCVSNSTKLKLKNSILARTSAALVRKPSITDQEMLQLRAGTGPDDSDSSESDDDDDAEEEEMGTKRKYSDDATPPSTANEHPPPLISVHQSSSAITTAAST